MKKNRPHFQVTINPLILFILILLFTNCKQKPSFRHEVIDPIPISKDDIIPPRSIPESHKAFMARFLPEIYKANNKILIQRNKILDLKDSLEETTSVSPGIINTLNHYLVQFRIDPVDPDTIDNPEVLNETIVTLLRRADIIPVKLVMAQAIIESGWGNSNFAREANNYFGMRCYSADCGIPPSENDSSGFLIKVYPSEFDGIEDYLWTLNTGFAYKKFRQLRSQLRSQNRPLDPVMLAAGLTRYSEKGDDYIKMVGNIIRNYIPYDIEEKLAGIADKN